MLPILFPLLLQVGLGPAAAPDPVAQLDLQHRPPPRTTGPNEGVKASPLEVCLDLARTNPAKAHDVATKWVARTVGAQRAMGNHCLGVANANMGKWDAARSAFMAAREEVSESGFRARMGALAGSVSLAAGNPQQALNDLDGALEGNPASPELRGSIEIDRASALVALGKDADAALALANAREELPGSAQAWLLSATLSRRMNRLAEAQQQIERAATLDPGDPAIGLEAGVIAALSGNDNAAIKSWRSVVSTSPDSPQAATAKNYITQLEAAGQ